MVQIPLTTSTCENYWVPNEKKKNHKALLNAGVRWFFVYLEDIQNFA